MPPRLHRALRRDGLVARFVPERHDGGTKTILGRSGAFGLHDVADILVAHPATARFLAGRLIAFFGASDPHGALQGRLAETFMVHAESEVQLAKVVEALLVSPEFDRVAARGNQVKSPVRLLVGAARQLALEIDPTPNLARYVEAMGQRLFDPPNVKGWPGGETWLARRTLAREDDALRTAGRRSCDTRARRRGSTPRSRPRCSMDG